MYELGKIVVAIAIGLVCCSFSHAVAQTASDKQKDFDAQIARVKKSDASVDFAKLRLLYTELDSYGPYGSDGTKDMFSALSKGDNKLALKLATEQLQSNYLNVDAQMVAMIASDKLGDAAARDHHKYVVKGIIDSIVGSGDGKSAATALRVISVDEEYALLRVYGLQMRNQGLNHIDGHSFDVLTVVDPETKQERTIYFNIDPIAAAEEKIFGK